jgi:uncharacterized protein (DUF488 family)
MICIYTIGFTKKTAEEFFTKLKNSGVKRIIDVRLNNTSQLAGFSKKDDLRFFLRKICEIDYIHMPELAPTKEILDAYKKGSLEWSGYEQRFIQLIALRQVEERLGEEILDGACLLCSEEKPDRCHRRLVAEYLRDKWNDVEITHLT